jgi:DNA modification methylase
MDFFQLLGPESVDAVITDPPYGIEMSNLAQTSGGQMDIDRIEETHDVKDNLENFPKWLKGCYDIIKPKGFCVWFCDAMHFRYLHDLGVELGFKVQRWPFVWVKTSSCSNQRAEYNFTKDTEIAIIFRKPGGKLTRSGPRSSWTGGLSAEDKAAGATHPFIKPFELWEALITSCVTPGGKIAEPFSGVGSGTRAIMKLGYLPISCEKDEKHYAQQVNNIANTYCQMNQVNFGK